MKVCNYRSPKLWCWENLYQIITTLPSFCFTPFPDMCGFDYGLCGLHNGVSHKGQWIRKRATEEEVDHTYGTDNGEYKKYHQHCLTILKKNHSWGWQQVRHNQVSMLANSVLLEWLCLTFKLAFGFFKPFVCLLMHICSVAEVGEWALSLCYRFLCDCEWQFYRENYSSTAHTPLNLNDWDVCPFLVRAFKRRLTLVSHR